MKRPLLQTCLIVALCTSFPLPQPGIAEEDQAAEIRTWTSASGATVEARFIEAHGEMAILERPGGARLKIALDKLGPEDQALVRSIAPRPEPTTATGGIREPTKPKQLPTFRDEKWTQRWMNRETNKERFKHAVWSRPTFEAWVDVRGILYIQPTCEQAQGTTGYPIRTYFHPKREDELGYRSVVAFVDPPAPSRNPERLHLKATLADDVSLELIYTVGDDFVTYEARSKDPKGLSPETVLRAGFLLPPSHNVKYESAAEQEEAVGHCELSFEGSKGPDEYGYHEGEG